MRLIRLILATLAALFLAAGAALAATVTVAPGDTLSGIAAVHGTSVATIAAANGIDDPNLIVAGTRLTVPGGGGGGASAGAAASEGSGGSTGGITVRPGDTLGAIAARAGTSVAALASANGIADPNLIVAGTRLTLPGGGSGGGGSGGAEAAVSSTSTTTPVPAGGYRVRPGDTLSGIAIAIGTTSAALASLNGMSDPNALVAGAILWVPTSAVPSRGAGSSGGGDVRSLIDRASARHGVDPALVRAVAWQESGWNQSAVSSAGAIGVMQLLPSTAGWLGDAVLGRPLDPNDVSDNIDGGVAYLAWLERQTGSQSTALASYYQGLTSVRRNGPLPETHLYVANVLAQVGRV